MIDPPIDELVKKAGDAYSLCTIISKRAKQLNQGANPLIELNSNKAVSIASHEFIKGKLHIPSKKQPQIIAEEKNRFSK